VDSNERLNYKIGNFVELIWLVLQVNRGLEFSRICSENEITAPIRNQVVLFIDCTIMYWHCKSYSYVACGFDLVLKFAYDSLFAASFYITP